MRTVTKLCFSKWTLWRDPGVAYGPQLPINISICQIQKTKATIDSSHRDLSRTIKTFSSWYGDLMRLYWLVWPQGCDDYLEKNCSIDFWSNPDAVTTFFLGCPGLALTGINGAIMFGVDSTIASTTASYHFFLCIARATCSYSLHGEHQESWGSTTGARRESRSTSCPRRSASS